LQVGRYLREPDAERVAMARVGTLVLKRRLDRAIVERLREIWRKQNPRPQQSDRRCNDIAFAADQRPYRADGGSAE
jgi:hypothetical protein